MKNKYVVLAVIVGVVVILDQWTKNLIVERFRHGESVDVIKNYFNITYVRNLGAAFGIFRDLQTGLRQSFFTLMPPIAMVVILFMLRSTPTFEKLRVFSLSCIFGGALGNYIDRLSYGYVVDFLDFHYKEFYSWPAFNVADISIVCGVTFLIFLEFGLMRKEWQDKRAATS